MRSLSRPMVRSSSAATLTRYDGVLSVGIARLNANGSRDTTLNTGEGASNDVNAVALQDGKILIAGRFVSYTMVSRDHIARLNANGTLDTTFDPGTGADGDVYAVVAQPDGKIVIGGEFTNYNATARNRIAGLNADGSLDATFTPGTGADQSLKTIAAQSDGKIIIGGGFTNYDGVARGRIARINPNGSLDTTFDPGTGAASVNVRTIAIQANGQIPIGGAFSTYNDISRAGIARVQGDLFVNWAAGDPTDKSIPLPIVDDALVEGNETLTLTLTNLTGGATAGAISTQTLTIIDNDFAPTPTPSPSPTPTRTTLANISTRLRVETGDNVLIGGFIVTGTQPKKVILRAIGPSLSVNGIPLPERLLDSTLELIGPGGPIALNDNWRSAQEAEIIASTIPPPSDLESAIVATLPANSSAYTAIVRGVGHTAGVGQVEVYDLDSTVDSQLANISTRGLVQTGDNVMIGGVILVGPGSRRVIVRAIGPSLPLPGKLADPTLQVADQNGVILAANDNWRTAQEAEIIATAVAPTNDLESAIVATLPAAPHTAIVRGQGGTTGVALVEAYALSN